MAERWLASGTTESRNELTAAMTQFPATAEETAAEYLDAGLWSDGAEVLSEAIAAAPDQTKIQPMLYYYRGYFDEKLNQPQKAAEDYALAAKMPSDYVFPFQNEAIDVLRAAMKANPQDAHAPYYLGNLLFDSQPDEAIVLWQTSAALDPSNAIVHRNLGIAFSHSKSGDSLDNAIAQMELAVALQHKYALHFTELDEMYEAEGVAPEKRLALLEDNRDVVAQRDDSLAREINLLVATGKFDQAITLLNSKEFAVWEGGSLSVADDWADAHLLRGRLHFEDKQYQEAIADFKAALETPSNLPSEDRINREPEADYYLGKAYQALGDQDQAKQYWQKSSAPEKASPAQTHSDHEGIGPRTIQAVYQAFSLRALGQNDQANAAFHALLDRANRVIEKQPAQFDPNAPLNDLLMQRTRFATAHYVAAMCSFGLDDKQKATEELNLALQAKPGLPAARFALEHMR
jgi:tetratricopeptide (TPR) repeat protein